MKIEQANSELLTQEQLKSIAFLQFNGEDYFLTESEGEYKIYKGTKDDEENAIEVEPIDGDTLTDGYMVLTDEEANEKASEYIKDSLWAFNADFIIGHSKLPWAALEMIQTFQAEKCESANETIEALIDDIDEFIEDAIRADGRGHFMSSYDGAENEETVNGETFFIYRID